MRGILCTLNFYFQATMCVGMIGTILLVLCQSVSNFHWYTEMEDRTERRAFSGLIGIIGATLVFWAVLVAPCVGG